MARRWHDPTVLAVVAITLGGLILRCVAARGALWLDEAWSAVFAHEVATPAGVFLSINHDNNHHLNSLWLQWVGPGAAPLMQRALSIAAGTALIPLAAVIAGRRSGASAILAAIGFAVAPFLVAYGSEARGYAPMLFAWGCAIHVVDRWLAKPSAPLPATALALAALLGCMAQATMVFALASLALWVAIVRLRSAGLRTTTGELVRLFAPAVVAVGLFAALAWAAVRADPAGFRFGSREAHDWARWASGLDQLFGWTLGLSAMVLLLGGFGRIVADRIGLLAVIAAGLLPLAVALLGLPNSGAARYYVVALPPLLLWAAIALPRGWAAGRELRAVTVVIGVSFVVGAAVRDRQLAGNLRGDPGRALDAMAARSLTGTTVSIEYPRSSAILSVAARQRRYPLEIVNAPCPAAPYRFVERDGDAAFPDAVILCGRRYREIARGDPTAVSGSHWRLYTR
ncbi:hypothetical protein ASG37_11845 [Sphingomonas sp. Leaf407]|uniref:hypothetical protein n=1 Tax=unclassified Sphingomonas TaxID=196159 RepID=UPI000701945C|nr:MULTISPECIES: hypothetical protein [unclassified Sphingomonas]KQN37706.1 hypothetical protein ASE97_09135 [Sphingomonas sp. Leaf42]KQT28073.1 hypothetical protein ASG37_11845 [Sphingomonas sp. Leaf407]